MKNKIACCSYPTTVLFIDDRESFLRNLAGSLHEDMVSRMYTKPRKALEEIQKYGSPFALQPAKITNVTDEYAEEYTPEQAHIVVDVDASNIYKAIYTDDRFKNIAVAVVDYAMPSMNGLEFAQQAKEIGNKFVKVLMLTGEADETLAVKAFNRGIIDKFIRKNSPSYADDLNNSISELQNNYFHEASQALISTLSANKECCLDDNVFINFFNDLCKEKNICEYYLADEIGSFLLADKNGKSYWLIVNSKNMLDNYANIAADGCAPANITKSLKNKEKVLFLFTQQNLYLSVVEWNKHLYPAKKLVGHKNEYYYAVIPVKKVADFHPEKIVSYERYLDKT